MVEFALVISLLLVLTRGLVQYGIINHKVNYNEYSRQGSGIATNEQWQWAIEGFKTLSKMAEEINLKLAFETHMGYPHDTAEVTKKTGG